MFVFEKRISSSGRQFLSFIVDLCKPVRSDTWSCKIVRRFYNMRYALVKTLVPKGKGWWAVFCAVFFYYCRFRFFKVELRHMSRAGAMWVWSNCRIDHLMFFFIWYLNLTTRTYLFVWNLLVTSLHRLKRTATPLTCLLEDILSRAQRW